MNDNVMQTEMTGGEADTQDTTVTQSSLGRLVHLGASEIHQAALQFARKSEALALTGEMAAVNCLRLEAEGTRRQLEHAQRTLIRESARAEETQESLLMVHMSQDDIKHQIDVTTTSTARLQQSLASLEKHAGQNPSNLIETMQSLVGKHDCLQLEMVELKNKFVDNLAMLQQELEHLRVADEAERDDDESKKIRDIEILLGTEEVKAMRMRQLLGHKGREQSQLLRQADGAPGSAELMQYERRFRELYEAVANKHEETRRYYALFNTVEEKKAYLAKEVKPATSEACALK